MQYSGNFFQILRLKTFIVNRLLQIYGFMDVFMAFMILVGYNEFLLKRVFNFFFFFIKLKSTKKPSLVRIMSHSLLHTRVYY